MSVSKTSHSDKSDPLRDNDNSQSDRVTSNVKRGMHSPDLRTAPPPSPTRSSRSSSVSDDPPPPYSERLPERTPSRILLAASRKEKSSRSSRSSEAEHGDTPEPLLLKSDSKSSSGTSSVKPDRSDSGFNNEFYEMNSSRLQRLHSIAGEGKLSRSESRHQGKIAHDIRDLTYKASEFLHRAGESENEEIQATIRWLNFEVAPLLREPVWNKVHSMPVIVSNILEENLERAPDHPEEIMRKDISSVQTAMKMGHGVQANKGATGTVIVTDINGKSLGIHKVSSKEVSLRTRVKNAFKQTFGGQLYFLSTKPMAQPQAERATFLLDRHHLGFNLAPPTRKATFGGKQGYFQQFVRSERFKYTEAKDNVTFLNKPSGDFQTHETDRFQQFAVLDYLTGNLDRHDENWFLAFNPDGTLADIKAIDNANSFPEKHPKHGALAARNQYQWKEYTISEVPFTAEFRAAMIEKLSDDNLEDMLTTIANDMPDFLTEKSDTLFLQRGKALRAILAQENSSPRTLAAYSDDKAMKSL